jgi:hypothetical protein
LRSDRTRRACAINQIAASETIAVEAVLALALVTSIASGISAALEGIAGAFRSIGLEAAVARDGAQILAHVVTSTIHVTARFLATQQEAKECTQA